jgi:hypothetical protein
MTSQITATETDATLSVVLAEVRETKLLVATLIARIDKLEQDARDIVKPENMMNLAAQFLGGNL